MHKSVRRFQLQPVVEGLDRRIAPSPFVSGGATSGPADTSTPNDADTSQNTNIGPRPVGTAGGNGGTKA